SWSPTFEITQTIDVTTTGVYIAEVTDDNGCVGTDDISVTVSNLLDPVIVASGPLAFCSGGSVTLSVGDYEEYLWSTSDVGASTTVTTSGVVEIQVWDEFGCSGVDEAIVSVLQLPNAVVIPTGPVEICNGDSIELSASGTFASYDWNPGTGNMSSIYVTESGDYTVTVEDPNNGCTATSDAVSVIVNTSELPTIVASGPVEFCDGESVSLSVEPGPYNSYLWTSGSTTPSIVVTNEGCYGVTVLDVNGCLDSTLLGDPLCVTVWDPQPSVESQGDNLVVTNGPFQSYQWYFNGLPIPGGAQANYLALESGNYYVEVTDNNGCSGTSFNIEHTISGITDLNLLYDISLYPNPTNGIFTLEIDFGKNVDATLTLSDVAGRKIIMPELIENVSSVKRTFDLENLAKGIYYLQLITEDGTAVKTIIRN
ncbi:MAG: T9SS type A sorting domain-containing protein, partial [Flavobacteriales bacterium]|nr:T9SS type A sorting domain-containing protein [Flavobacteriales bacterium]